MAVAGRAGKGSGVVVVAAGEVVQEAGGQRYWEEELALRLWGPPTP